MSNKNIKIMIACHKPTELPTNPLYLPIHVGAANSSIRLEGMQRDDDGEDNISFKNASYCEMTAQYWAWKNLEADYYGLCHYRRYFCFSPKEFPNTNHDGRNQTIGKILTPETEEKYGLLNEALTREIVENNDIIVCRKQDISSVWTPKGCQKSLYNHYKAHHNVMVNINDIDLLIEVVGELYPIYKDEFIKYLNGKWFYGYNMFVLRKDIFCELCSFEFSILEEVEKRIEDAYYSIQLKRVYGYLGEILQSFYIDHLIKTKKELRSRELQLVFFERTDRIVTLKPKTNTIPVVVDLFDAPLFLFSVVLVSLANNCKYDCNYEIILVAEEFNEYYKNIFNKYIQAYPNISLRYIDFINYRNMYYELDEQLSVSFKLLAPIILKEYNRIISLSWNCLICADLQELYEKCDESAVYATRNILQQAQINDQSEYMRKRLSNYFSREQQYQLFDTNMMVMNLEKCRDVLGNSDDYWELMKKSANEDVIINKVYYHSAGLLSFAYNYFVPQNDFATKQLANAPAETYIDYKAYKNQAIIKTFDKGAIWDGNNSETFITVWEMIQNTVFLPHYIEHMAFRFGMFKNGRRSSLKDVLFPRGSRRRMIAKKLFPRNGIVRRVLKR